MRNFEYKVFETPEALRDFVNDTEGVDAVTVIEFGGRFALFYYQKSTYVWPPVGKTQYKEWEGWD